MNPESIDLAEHLGMMHEMLASSARGHPCRDEIRPRAWHVEIDAGELEFAIVNLCVNARDAMPHGGTITIAAENVHEMSGDGSPAEVVRLSVADTGMGIPADHSARFRPLLHDQGCRQGIGTWPRAGLRVRSAIGGRVSIASNVGVGTVVTAGAAKIVARAQETHTVIEAPAVPLITGAPDRRGELLLVEDDAEVAALAREMLGELGFSVMHVSSPSAALGALANGRAVDAVFSDIMMPGGISGLDLAREIRRRHPAVPIVLATGYADSAVGMKDGEFRLLLKPYSLEALANALAVEMR